MCGFSFFSSKKRARGENTSCNIEKEKKKGPTSSSLGGFFVLKDVVEFSAINATGNAREATDASFC